MTVRDIEKLWAGFLVHLTVCSVCVLTCVLVCVVWCVSVCVCGVAWFVCVCVLDKCLCMCTHMKQGISSGL